MKFQFLRNLDKTIVVITGIIFFIGLLSIYSATHCQGIKFDISNFVFRQALWMILALIIFILVLYIDYQRFIDWAYILYGGTLVMLMLVLALGRTRLGAQRWFSIGFFTLQPSEFVKITSILALSAYLGCKARFSYRPSDLLIPIAIILPASALIVMQPDLGTALTLVPIFAAVLFMRGANVKHLLILAAGALLSTPFFWHLLKDYQRQRLLVFINPNIDPLGAGYTVIQSKIAVGSGMLFGKGWLGGTQNQLNFLPERHTDFIFSVIGEEWGFLGSSVLIILYAIIIYRGLCIVTSTTDTYGKILAAGIVAMLSFQIVVNIGMTMGLMPVVGLPLPLLSYGGSSLMATMISIALLLNVGMRKPRF